MNSRTQVVRVANPRKRNAVLAALGMPVANPQGGSMKKGKKKNKATTAGKKRNRAAVVSARPASAVHKAGTPKRNGRRRGKRNPVILGQSISTTDLAMALVAGLVGVTAAKMIPTMLPESIVGSDMGRIAATAVAAVGAGYVAKEINPKLGLFVAFGGGMQVMSIMLNRFLPTIGSRISLQGVRGGRRGVGTLVDTNTPINVFNPLLMTGGGTPAGATTPGNAAMLAFAANSNSVYGSDYQ